MDVLPRTPNPLLLRTDFSDDTAWLALCRSAQAPSPEGFRARVDWISDPALDGLTVQHLVGLLPSGEDDHSVVFVADRVTFEHQERPVLAIDLYDQPGRTFRVIPGQMWAVENNLSLANMDFEEFAESVDSDGVFRGFPV